ncbi:MAG: hypothetical protein M3O30_10680 [Planctomycetota bacterium]|nr:hypothetical protein [Planctomycetota bacterium]
MPVARVTTKPNKIRFHAIGLFKQGSVTAQWVADSRPRHAEIEAAIDAAWVRAAARPGVNLFDGPMCRLESFAVTRTLELKISPTSYKIFTGTNVANPLFATRFGWASLANPIGVSSALETRDGYLMLGQRNASVAYYPLRVHPFAGALEPSDSPDVFAEARRELHEELAFSSKDILEIECLGLAEDASLRQPELIFRVRSSRTRAQIEATLDVTEHTGAIAVRAHADELARLAADPSLTPVAVAAVLLVGRQVAGAPWFEEVSRPVTLAAHE